MPLRDPPIQPQTPKSTPRGHRLAESPSNAGDWLDDLRHLRILVAKCDAEIAGGRKRRLPGQTAFLSDGRVLCRERGRGDSRYPYGRDGLNFWVSASGHMHGNFGLFFLFLPSNEGQEPPIAFFAGRRRRKDGKFRPHSLLPTPHLGGFESLVTQRYAVIGHDAIHFVAESDDLLSAVRVFVDQTRPEHPHIHFSTLVCNTAEHGLDIFTSAYMNPFCRHQFVPTNEDRWFKKIHVAETFSGSRDGAATGPGLTLAPFVVTTNEDVNRFQSVSNYALIRRALQARNHKTRAILTLAHGDGGGPESEHDPRGADILVETQVCTARLGYMGSPRRQLDTAAFLERGCFEHQPNLTVFNDMAVVGDLIRMTLPADACVRADYVFSVPDNGKVLELELCKFIDGTSVDRAMDVVGRREQRTGDFSLQVGGGKNEMFDAETFNHFLPFLKKQVAVCAQLKGYMHPSPNSLIGFRDVFQAIEGHLFDRPGAARAKILEATDYVLSDGRCPRQYSLPVNGAVGRADLREFIDQGAWLISAIHTYLAVTGDASLLGELARYHRVDPSDGAALVPTGEQSSVLDHLLRIMDYLARCRDPETGLVLAMYGDWNDALDGLGTTGDPRARFGTGVSVMTSLQLYAICAEMIEILRHFAAGKHKEEVERFERLSEQLSKSLLRYAVVYEGDERRVVHGWGDQRRYFVGSFHDSDGKARDGLTSNAFWVLCGMLNVDATLKENILAALDRLDSPLGLKTFAPGFEPDAPGVGRITRLPLGAAENGAVYIHATTFAIDALFCMGRPRQAWRQIEKILPFSAHHHDPSHSVFVMPNSYVDNPELNLTGQSMNDWQTGCSNVLLKLLIRRVAGFDPCMEHLRVAPAEWMPFESLEFWGKYHGRRVRIVLRHSENAQRAFHVNGRLISRIRRDATSRQHYITVSRDALSTDGVNEVTVTGSFHD